MLSPINNINLPWCNEKTKHSQWWTSPKCACYCALWFMAMAYLCLDVSQAKCMRKMDGWVSQVPSSSVPLSSVNNQSWFVVSKTHLSSITSTSMCGRMWYFLFQKVIARTKDKCSTSCWIIIIFTITMVSCLLAWLQCTMLHRCFCSCLSAKHHWNICNYTHVKQLMERFVHSCMKGQQCGHVVINKSS